jgi:hypothetical protein
MDMVVIGEIMCSVGFQLRSALHLCFIKTGNANIFPIAACFFNRRNLGFQFNYNKSGRTGKKTGSSHVNNFREEVSSSKYKN